MPEWILLIGLFWPGQTNEYIKSNFPNKESCFNALEKTELKMTQGGEAEWAGFKTCVPKDKLKRHRYKFNWK